ncbi:MAG: adenylate cyclase [Pseudomonadota bacterium]
MKHLIIPSTAITLMLATCGALAAPAAGHAPATVHATPRMSAPATTPKTTGQPNQSCGSLSAPTTPGNAATAPGSAFNPDGKAGSVYAGEQTQNSRNPKSVSQYDAACAHQPTR